MLTGVVRAAEPECGLDCKVANLLAEQKLTGAVYGIVEGDTTRVGAAGTSNAATGTPLAPDSKVHVGSIAKTMLSLGVLRLVTEARISLDTPVETVLPQIRFDNPWQAQSPVRLRHLLDHTAGLDDARLWQVFSAQVQPTSPLIGAFTRDGSVLRIRTEPGRQVSYSNMGYTLVGMIIESVTGEPYERWLDRELLAPMGLRDSTFGFVTQSGPAADARLAYGHDDKQRPVAALPIWLRPAGQFTTTAADMAQVARFIMGDGRINEKSFVSRELLRAMGRPVTTVAARARLAAGYALGLEARDRNGAIGRCHGGAVIGFRAMFCVYPEIGKAFFIAHNMDSEDAQYARFDALMTQTVGATTAPLPAITLSLPQEWQGRYAPSPSRFESFRYTDALSNTVAIGLSADGIALKMMGGQPRTLVAVGPGLYRAADRTAASHVLLTDETGERYLSNGVTTFRKRSALWHAAVWANFGLGVAGLAFFAVAIPVQRVRRKEPLLQPASFALLMLVVPIPLLALQPFTVIGDVTSGSVALYAGTLMLPLLMIAQAAWICFCRKQIRWWLAYLVAVACVLQWCVALAMWGMLPFALWR